MRNTPSLVLASLLAAVVGVAFDGAARAADAPVGSDAASQVKAALAELETAVKAKDEAAATVAAKKLPALYKATQDDAIKTQIVKGLAEVVKQTKLPSARNDALLAIVATEDSKDGWRFLQSSYPKDDEEDATGWNKAYLGAIGSLHPDGAIEKLLESFRKGKQAEHAAAAVTALGNYHKSKRREMILEEVVKSGKNMVPSRSATKNASPDAIARWATMSTAIGKALDMLTGENIGDPLEWFKRVDEAKKNYKGLFRD